METGTKQHTVICLVELVCKVCDANARTLTSEVCDANARTLTSELLRQMILTPANTVDP